MSTIELPPPAPLPDAEPPEPEFSVGQAGQPIPTNAAVDTVIAPAVAPPAAPTAPSRSDRRTTAETLAAGRDQLLRLQNDIGWWKGELETNVTMDAEDLMLRHIVGVLDPAVAARAARLDPVPAAPRRHLGNFFAGPADVSTTVEAYVALRLAGDDAGRAAHGSRGGVRPRIRRPGVEPGVHPDLAGDGRRVVVGRPARRCRRS